MVICLLGECCAANYCIEKSLVDLALGDPVRAGEGAEVLGRSTIDWKLAQKSGTSLTRLQFYDDVFLKTALSNAVRALSTKNSLLFTNIGAGSIGCVRATLSNRV